MYKRTKTGVLLAQSADATCHALYSPTEGPQTLQLIQGRHYHQSKELFIQVSCVFTESDPEPQCLYPNWLTKYRRWSDMALTLNYAFGSSETSMRQYSINASLESEVVLEAICSHQTSDETDLENFKSVTFVTKGWYVS